MNCLDTYALIEVAKGNSEYVKLFEKEFLITNETLAEFFWVVLRDFGSRLAEEWYKKLASYGTDVKQSLLIEAMRYRFEHKKENLSFFDCVGYLYAQTENHLFVTGDKEFKDKKGVLFIK